VHVPLIVTYSKSPCSHNPHDSIGAHHTLLLYPARRSTLYVFVTPLKSLLGPCPYLVASIIPASVVVLPSEQDTSARQQAHGSTNPIFWYVLMQVLVSNSCLYFCSAPFAHPSGGGFFMIICLPPLSRISLIASRLKQTCLEASIIHLWAPTRASSL